MSRRSARSVAVDVLDRIDGGAYANLVLPAALEHSGLTGRDRDFVTELVYGTTRMRRAVDWLVDAHLRGDVEPRVRNILRAAAYQLHFLRTPAHAGVGEMVEIAPKRAKGLVNAVLRRVAENVPVAWPDRATELSYPDWIVERLADDLGSVDADDALSTMNTAPSVSVRTDGYVQDVASQWVAGLVEAGPGLKCADVCAAPGGKATALAAAGADVAALDVLPARAGLVAGNARRLGYDRVGVAVADGRLSPLRPARFDRVLVDAPCSGLGVLRRRPDARWRIQQGDVDQLAGLQRQLLRAAVPLLRPGGLLVYSACTMTTAETIGVDDWLACEYPSLRPRPAPPAPWRSHGRGGLLLPQAAGTDGMFVLRLAAPG